MSQLADLPITLLLAGGRGRRFHAAGGAPFKQTREFAKQPLLLHTAQRYQRAGLPVAIALHPDLAYLEPKLNRAGFPTQCIEEADKGLGHTLSAAVQHWSCPHGWLIALADMPAVRVESIRAVWQALQQGRSIVRPTFAGTPGHPVAFHARWSTQLAACRGAAGAASLLRDQDVHYVSTQDPGVIQDIDTPADWHAVTQQMLR